MTTQQELLAELEALIQAAEQVKDCVENGYADEADREFFALDDAFRRTELQMNYFLRDNK